MTHLPAYLKVVVTVLIMDLIVQSTYQVSKLDLIDQDLEISLGSSCSYLLPK